MPYPFQTVGQYTGSIYSGSYFNETDNKLFYHSSSRDFWFGFSPFDVTEVSLFDFENNQITWDILDDQPRYKTLTYSYENEKDEIVEYSYNQFISEHILYKNDKILEQITDHLSELGISNGDYQMVFNYTRLSAGGPGSPLSIQEISPSRKELKIVPMTDNRVRFDAFCQKKFQIKDVSSLLIQLTNGCPYDDLYRKVKDQYLEAISFLQTLFFLQTDGDVLRFLKNLHEDYVRYVSLSATDLAAGESPDRIQRIQGIRTYFQNWMRSNNDSISDFDLIEQKYIEYVLYRINQQYAPYKVQTGADYASTKKFLYDFFVQHFYKKIVDPLKESYQNKYNAYLKNALNFGQNRLLLILNYGVTEENGEKILLVKLAEELPGDIKLRDECWISNLGMVPFVFTVSVRGSVSGKTVRISPPDFLAKISEVNTKNINKLYTADDLRQDTSEKSDNILIQKKITELNVDYSAFDNFVVFSSAVNRLAVFKNKVLDWTNLSSSLADLRINSSSAYPYFVEEEENIEEQMTEVVESFDGYESYLFNADNYTYNLTLSEWNSSSYVTAQDDEAAEYDRSNPDSLVNNTPQYLVLDEDNDEYLTFLAMVGHYFDNLYLYIKSMPVERAARNQTSGSMSVNMLREMLGSFGWNVDDILANSSPENVYLSAGTGASNELSDSERMRNIWNRLLVTLPQLYKTKGTEECVRLILACHGIPNDLITVKEYGGIDYSAGSKVSYVQNEKIFMMHFTPSNALWSVPFPRLVKTLEFKFAVDDYSLYSNNTEIPLVISYPPPYGSGPGYWQMGLKKEAGKYDGRVYFRIWASSSYSLTAGSNGVQADLTSSILPIFNGNIFSVMLRRNYPESLFSTSSAVSEDDLPARYDLYVQQNESGRVVFSSTESRILTQNYNKAFSDLSKPTGSRLFIGNWSHTNGTATVGNNFSGMLDKIRLWKVPIDDVDFEDHVNDFNSYSWFSASATHPLQENLYFVSDVHYPIDVADPNYVTGSASGSFGVYIFPNANEYYRAPDHWYYSGSNYTGSFVSSSADQVSWIPYSSSFDTGSSVLFYNAIWQNISHSLDSGSCVYTTHSVYPYQYVPVNVNQSYPVGTYGPNKFKNNKIRKTTLQLEVRLDDRYSSTSPTEKLVSSDSNIFGFFIDPQDFKNKDAVRYFGNEGILSTISDPQSIYSSSYTELTDIRNRYNRAGDKKVLFNELISLNKLYFDQSIFNTIQSVAPARANTLKGVLIEPSIIERPKYQYKRISSSLDADTNLQGTIVPTNAPEVSLLWAETDRNATSIPRAYPDEYYAFVEQKNHNPGIVYPLWYPRLVAAGEIVTYKGFEYLIDDYQKILRDESMPPNHTSVFDLTAISHPNTIYPPNPVGWYISDFPDEYQFGWFGDRAGQARNDSVVANGVNLRGATYQKNMKECASGSNIYYLLKRWRKYHLFAKSGSYVHDENPRDDWYVTSSIYLYDIIHVTEDFYKQQVYMTAEDPRETGDPSKIHGVGYGYHHLPNTFVSTSNEYRSHIKAYPLGGGTETDLGYYEEAGMGYFELLTGYPRNHYVHKSQLFSPTVISQPSVVPGSTGSIFLKGRQTIDTTIDTGSLGDNSLPVESIDVSDVNIVAGDNVLD